MSNKQHFKLDTPAKKFFACQLAENSPWFNQALRDSSNKSVVVRHHHVWCQGRVVLVSADGNNLLLDDGTGILLATGATKIVNDLSICKGKINFVFGY